MANNNPNNQTKNEAYPSILKPWEKIAGLILVIAIIGTPALLTQFSTIIGFDESSGFIGDTIGGITAPFIGIAAAYLVFRSFEAQILANRLLRKDHERQMNTIRKEQSQNQIRQLAQSTFTDFKEREMKDWVETLLAQIDHIKYEYIQAKGDLYKMPAEELNGNLIFPIARLKTSLTSFDLLVVAILDHEKQFVTDKSSPIHQYYDSIIIELLSVKKYKLLSFIDLSHKSLGVLDQLNKDNLENIIFSFHELERNVGPVPLISKPKPFFII